MNAQRMVTPLLSCLVGAFLLSGCKDHVRARASADPDRAHAKATARGADDDDDAYDAGRVARTGVYIDAKIASACGVHEPEAFFAFDSAEVTPSARDTLELVAECLEDGALNREVVLVGHADPRGSDEYNEELGMTRAQAVAGFLRQSGVPKTRIETKSEGEDGASNDERGWPLDRRVDITLDESR
ncbi:MAG TPA: OmpA family protein [Nannocystaceae bacterium]|nr:OmpA family protein [Nannocystaceae bacterium]